MSVAEARDMGYKKAYDEVRAEFTKKYGPLNPSEGNGEKMVEIAVALGKTRGVC